MADTTYTHIGVVNFSPSMFYEVVAMDTPLAVLANVRNGMDRQEMLLPVPANPVSFLKFVVEFS